MTRRRYTYRVEVMWILRFWIASWRGRRSAPLVRANREREIESYSFTGAHALHEAATP